MGLSTSNSNYRQSLPTPLIESCQETFRAGRLFVPRYSEVWRQ